VLVLLGTLGLVLCRELAWSQAFEKQDKKPQAERLASLKTTPLRIVPGVDWSSICTADQANIGPKLALPPLSCIPGMNEGTRPRVSLIHYLILYPARYRMSSGWLQYGATEWSRTRKSILDQSSPEARV